ncbi:MAG: polyamine aminopropyltransferase [Bacteroidales bacterium]|nr:polyamine aminopropyltransferase [Bacteroidales bacterium]MCF8456882.1 polyamine aminopropyltransferase [Bacteroidales bacterium]
MHKLRSNILKLALFATGLSGIVAEYILSTLATYFLGDSVLQWTLIVSVMLFSMGLGSRFSQYLRKNLLQKFIFIEFALSVLVSYSSLAAYTISAFTVYNGFIIYFLSILIGVLIGMEIPLVVRLNEENEELRVNVSSVMEKDYFGSLLGGLFFAFVALPYIGLTYTPFILGMVNFLVAILLIFLLWNQVKTKFKRSIQLLSIGIFGFLVAGFFMAKPIIFFGEQMRYKDKIVFEEQSKYQKIVITQWKDNHWLFINGNQQLSTLDEVMYHEPLVHPAMSMAVNPTNILVMGGGDGCAVREILKYPSVETITLVDLDPAMTRLGQENPIIKELNQNSMNNPKLHIKNEDGYNFIEHCNDFYDVIIIDLPDPRTVELGRLYSYEFYSMCYRQLRPHGVLVSQSGSPYYATKAFRCIEKTMAEAGFSVLPYHNQVITLGEWGWVLGTKLRLEKDQVKQIAQSLDFKTIETQWINKEAMTLMTSFGKDIFIEEGDTIKVNRIHDPVLYRYYLKGNWEFY